MMFDGFSRRRVQATGAEINVAVGGSGPPLLLLHGYPQTHLMWHKVAPELARDFTLVVPDLRGYGDSSKPEDGDNHASYSKRAMAKDQVEVMQALGFETFLVAGHDRGARVAHRMVLDYDRCVKKLAVLDIVPTLKVFDTVDQRVASSYFHWFFLSQPAPFPERLIGADPDYYLMSRIARWGFDQSAFHKAAVEEYLRCFRDPACIHATCEDYRAGAGIDLEHDRADLRRKVVCPTLVLWGGRGFVAAGYDALACWRERAADVRGRALDCGHFLPEEKPAETTEELREFFLDS
jgi:haloacetate dehalogenase